MATLTSRTTDPKVLELHHFRDHAYFGGLARKAISATYHDQNRGSGFTMAQWGQIDRRIAGLAEAALERVCTTDAAAYVSGLYEDRIVLGCNAPGCGHVFQFCGQFHDDGGRTAGAIMRAYAALTENAEYWECPECEWRDENTDPDLGQAEEDTDDEAEY